MFDGGIRLLEAVLDKKVEVVALVEDFALDVRIELPESPNFLVLASDELLGHRGDLDVHVLFREIEVRAEQLGRFTGFVPFNGEFPRLVLPVNTVKVEESRKFPFAVVCEFGEFRPRGPEEIV